MSPKNRRSGNTGLFIVATPIGNLKDISLRAIEVLQNCDIILCEDTRVSRKLMAAHNIKTPLLAYHDHNGEKVRPKIMGELLDGKSIALISDAGTPLISDPGFKLVKEAHNHEICVTPIPGASAFLAGLSASGLPTDKFIFLGFLPVKKKSAENLLLEHLSLEATQIYYETAPRIEKTLNLLDHLAPDRELVIARELTKSYEEIIRGTASDILLIIKDRNAALKGEIVLMIAPSECSSEMDDDTLSDIITEELQTHTISHAVKIIAQKFKLPRNRVYDLALKISKK